jgi:hypothetical protein
MADSDPEDAQPAVDEQFVCEKVRAASGLDATDDQPIGD